MKPLLFAFTIITLLLSCSKDKTAATATVPVNVDSMPVKMYGTFTSTAGINVTGNVKIVSSGTVFSAVLDSSFLVSAGPDLKVYLSKKNTPFEFVNLGPLKSNTGRQVYDVPAGINLAAYPYVLIHCQQYNHLFAIAELKP